MKLKRIHIYLCSQVHSPLAGSVAHHPPFHFDNANSVIFTLLTSVFQSHACDAMRGGKQVKLGDWAKYDVCYKAAKVALQGILGHHETSWPALGVGGG